MGWKIKRREDTKPCRLNTCLCFDLRMGTFLGAWIILLTNVVAFILVILDLAAWMNNNFEIEGSYYTWWRQSFWKGFYTCDFIMIFAHLILIVPSIILITSILRPASCVIYLLLPVVKAWWIILLLHTICELGISVYTYSFYGLAAWRLPFLIFSHMFYIIRFLFSVLFMFVAYSYQGEIQEQLDLGIEQDPNDFDDAYELGMSEAGDPNMYAFS